MPGEGFEPPTNGLQNRCSTAELTRPQVVRLPHIAACGQCVTGQLDPFINPILRII